MNNLALENELSQLLENNELSTVFQPIFDIINKKILGYEALIRLPKNHPISNPTLLFKLAHQTGYLSKLESICRHLAFKGFVELGLTGKLFLNISPFIIADHNHQQGETIALMKHYHLTPDRIVIEISEKVEQENSAHLQESLRYYRKIGFDIAIDDLGTGYSGLKLWAELRPNIVKVDQYFINNAHNNIVKRELLRTIFELGKATGVKIIAEGIEHENEFLLLEKMGMQYGQGNLLAPANNNVLQKLPALLTTNKAKTVDKDNIECTEILDLVEPASPIAANETCTQAYKRFEKNSDLLSIAIINEVNEPVGIIHRDQLTELFSGEYGHALYHRKPVSMVMASVPFIVDVNASLVEVSDLITSDNSLTLRQDFIVVKNGKYMGLANIRILLKKMTEEKIRHAQHANPLTMLPGNIVIEEKINKLLKKQIEFHLAYFDLNHFKPFNDLYGYAAGDEIIKLVADVINTCCTHEKDFTGHVGGDDFVVIFRSSTPLQQCNQIIQEFNQRVATYFEPEHIKQKGYEGKNREGNTQFFPLLSLSCGVIQPNSKHCKNHHDVAVLASEAKKQAKQMEDNTVYFPSAKQVTETTKLMDYDDLIGIHTELNEPI